MIAFAADIAATVAIASFVYLLSSFVDFVFKFCKIVSGYTILTKISSKQANIRGLFELEAFYETFVS